MKLFTGIMKKFGTHKMKQKLQAFIVVVFFGFFALVLVPGLFITNAEKDSVIINNTKRDGKSSARNYGFASQGNRSRTALVFRH